MSEIEWLLPRTDAPLTARLSRLRQCAPAMPFAETTIAIATAVSQSLMADTTVRQYGGLMAFAHWLRPAHLQQLADMYRARASGGYRVAVGTVLHFAPANVDTVCLYSWFMSWLCGNRNIVRVSTDRSDLVDLALQHVSRALAGHAAADAQCVLTYAHDAAITAQLSAACDHRVIWGGDAAIAAIRQAPLPASATDTVFADKTSMAAIDANAVLAMSAEALHRLAEALRVDVYTFDQLACSSPRVVVWTGSSEAIAEASARFWPVFERVAVRPAPAIGMLIKTAAFALASDTRTTSVSQDGTAPFARVTMTDLDASVLDIHCGGGLILELHRASLADIGPLLSRRTQTLAVAGYTPADVDTLLRTLREPVLHRIVPIGQALDFQPVWDGQDLFHAFTREVARA